MDNKAFHSIELGERNGSKGGNASDISFTKGNSCSNKSRLEKGLIFMVVVFLLAVIGLVIAVVLIKKNQDESEVLPDVCLTTDCARAAARISENIDSTINPCEDFYAYACGGWKRKNIIPEDKSGQNMFGVLRDDVQVVSKYLLEDENSYQDVTAIQKAKDMYASCVNEADIESKDYNVAIPLLEELGGWPVLGLNPGGNWDENQFNLSNLLGTLRKYSNRPIIDMYISSDVKDSENRVIYLDQPGFGMPGRTYYLLESESIANMRKAYTTLAVGVAVEFKADPNTTANDMEDMLALETEIANITTAAEDRRDNEVLYNKMTIEQMAVNFTEPGLSDNIQFSWLEYINGVMSLDGVNVPINQSEPIVIRDVPYYERILGVLNKYSKRTIANYVIWVIMKNRASNLPARYRALITTYNEAIYGTSTSRARWRDCGSYVELQYGMALGHMFVKEAFDESAKAIALEMIQNIRAAFNELLDDLDWMDKSTKILAREKAEAIREWIGYPDDILDVVKLNELYANVTVNKTEYFQNILNNLQRSSIGGLQDLRKKYDKNVWTTPPSTVNAFYNSILNIIMFPAGILQPPFYDKYQPKSMNYGGIGVVIGHEITHGFDDRGRQYDKDGNLAEWWDQTIVDNFKQKAQCIIDQYSNYVLPEAGLPVKGINTQGENIADNGGLKQSFRAYRKWVDAQGKEEPTLPGLNFTNNQLFFVNFAQIWCNNIRENSAINSINNGVHSPGQFRVIGTLQNSPDFSEAFNCPATSYMNTNDKCYVW